MASSLHAQITTPEDVNRLGTILGIWAHPDDESFLAGGLLATAARNGQTVVCVTATRGEAGVQDPKRWPPERLGKIRAAELKAAFNILGLRLHHWLGYADGELAQVPEAEVVARLRRLMERYRPDTIVTFGPEGLTGHPDHQAVSRWAGRVAALSPPRPRVFHAVLTPEQYRDHYKPADEQLNFFFNIDQPPQVPAKDCAVAYELPDDIQELKHQAFVAMPSQMEQLCRVLGDEKFHQIFGAEYFVEYQPEAAYGRIRSEDQARVVLAQ